MTLLIYFVLFVSFFFIALNLLPVAGVLPNTVTTSFAMFVSYMKSWNILFPITELLLLAGLVVTFELAIVFWRIIKWVISIVRGNTSA